MEVVGNAIRLPRTSQFRCGRRSRLAARPWLGYLPESAPATAAAAEPSRPGNALLSPSAWIALEPRCGPATRPAYQPRPGRPPLPPKDPKLARHSLPLRVPSLDRPVLSGAVREDSVS